MNLRNVAVAALALFGLFAQSTSAQHDSGAEAPAWHLAHGISATETPDEIVARARAELQLRRPDRARDLLRALDSADQALPAVAELLATAELATGDPLAAAGLLAKAAAATSGRARGILWARAGDAFERADSVARARAAYDAAALELSNARGWIAIRQARLAVNPLTAFERLRAVPLAARPLAAEVRARVYLEQGDSVKAIGALEQAGRRFAAAETAFLVGDSAEARRLLYQALRSDTGEARAAVRTIVATFPPKGSDELARVVTVLRSFDRQRAAALLRAAVQAGDTVSRTLRFLGDVEASLGRPAAALAAYERGGNGRGGEAMRSRYRRARLLIRIGRTAQGYAALEEFARSSPEASLAPLAGYLVAERALRRGSTSAADLLTWVASTWPTHAYGSRARIQAAALALRGGDTEAALDWYRREIQRTGAERHAARFFTAQIRQQLRDTAGARAHWSRLARDDSLGYYGTVARELAGIPAVVVAAAAPPEPHPSVAHAFARLDLLAEMGFEPEVQALVDHLIAHTPDGDRLLEVAERLSERGWVVEGIRLGWRVAGTRSLNDPRVLRVIYPYPLPVRALIEQEAVEHGVDPYLLVAVVRQESAFREAVVSRAGAKGLMQLMPSTAVQVARRLGVEWDADWLAVADANLHLGAAHLASLLRRYQRVAPALAAYNAGGTPVARWLRLPDANNPYWFTEQIPYRETRGYVRAVVRNHSLYRALYPPANGGPSASP